MLRGHPNNGLVLFLRLYQYDDSKMESMMPSEPASVAFLIRQYLSQTWTAHNTDHKFIDIC